MFARHCSFQLVGVYLSTIALKADCVRLAPAHEASQ